MQSGYGIPRLLQACLTALSGISFSFIRGSYVSISTFIVTIYKNNCISFSVWVHWVRMAFISYHPVPKIFRWWLFGFQ